MRRIVVALLVLFSSTLPGQTRSGQTLKTSLCEIVSNPQRFNGKQVELRGEFVAGFQWVGFVDDTCLAKISVDPYGIWSIVNAPDGRALRPLQPKQDRNYRDFRKFTGAKFKWPDGGRCQDCPLYRVFVTPVGRFDYAADDTIAARSNRAVAAGGSSSDAPLMAFALESVSDVATAPVDPTVYSSAKPRELPLEESYSLVMALLKDRAKGAYALDPYEVKDYPAFQFFQALPDPTNGEIHFAVDRQTGEVWSAVFCEALTSPSLTRLLNAIRTRAGLTAERFQKVRRRGPRCED